MIPQIYACPRSKSSRDAVSRAICSRLSRSTEGPDSDRLNGVSSRRRSSNSASWATAARVSAARNVGPCSFVTSSHPDVVTISVHQYAGGLLPTASDGDYRLPRYELHRRRAAARRTVLPVINRFAAFRSTVIVGTRIRSYSHGPKMLLLPCSSFAPPPSSQRLAMPITDAATGWGSKKSGASVGGGGGRGRKGIPKTKSTAIIPTAEAGATITIVPRRATRVPWRSRTVSRAALMLLFAAGWASLASAVALTIAQCTLLSEKGLPLDVAVSRHMRRRPMRRRISGVTCHGAPLRLLACSGRVRGQVIGAGDSNRVTPDNRSFHPPRGSRRAFRAAHGGMKRLHISISLARAPPLRAVVCILRPPRLLAGTLQVAVAPIGLAVRGVLVWHFSVGVALVSSALGTSVNTL